MDRIPTVEYLLDNPPGTPDPIDRLVVKGVIILGSTHGHTSLQGFSGPDGRMKLNARDAPHLPEEAIGLHPQVMARGEMVTLAQTVSAVLLLAG